MRNESGITIFELMVVIGIIAILASIAIPGFLSWLPNYKMRSAVDEVLSTLQQAKLRAVRENAMVSVTFNTASGRYLAFVDNGAGADGGNGIQDAGEATIKNGQMPEGIILQSTTFPLDWARFTPRGIPVNGGDVVITNGPITRTIELTLGGSSSIQ